ncbi:hypothetical protein AKJ09_04831 [Labilithrix luteola]|uniref:Transposase IS200-like domain-containing protein n=1 Tax=Labilithrix luteola TaxID=1391654 RepID=A0A0K1PXC3_9BACT|nr:hypothetical protein AKJ09_04831 [Labilithrix luteola]
MLAKVLESAVRATRRDDFRIVEYSIQEDHVHTIVEASSKQALERGMRSFTVRASKRLKKALGVKRCRIWGDRYHRRDLTSPRQVRNALVYVIANFKKHQRLANGAPRIDLYSSAQWFTGWIQHRTPPSEGSPVMPSRTWLGSTGWKKHGLIHPGEAPSAPVRPPGRDIPVPPR